MKREELLNRLADAIVAGDIIATSEAAQALLDAGVAPADIVHDGAMKGLGTLGERFKRLQAYLPDLVKGGDAMKACMAVLMPHTEKQGGLTLGKVVIGSVFGDIHDIGKNLVSSMLMAAGFEVYDLGINVPSKQFIEKAEEVQAKIIALSALLTMTAYHQEEVIGLLKEKGLREKYYVVIGGVPTTPEWARKIGADGYGKTAIHAAQLCTHLLKDGKPPPLPQPLIFQ